MNRRMISCRQQADISRSSGPRPWTKGREAFQMAFTLPYYMNYTLKSQRQLTVEAQQLKGMCYSTDRLETRGVFRGFFAKNPSCTAFGDTPFVYAVSAVRSRSVKNAADTKLFAAPGLAKSKYRRFSRPASPAMHKRLSRNQAGLNCNKDIHSRRQRMVLISDVCL